MKAQTLYDLRNKYEFCSGQDLAEWFDQQTGDMAPPGEEEIQKYEAIGFVKGCFEAIAHNSPSLAEWARKTEAKCFWELTKVAHVV